MLVRYFAQKYARRMNRNIETHSGRNPGRFAALSLAGKCSRTRKPDRARRDSLSGPGPARASDRAQGGARNPPSHPQHPCRRRTRAHSACAGRTQVAFGRAARRRSEAGHEAHHVAVPNAEARYCATSINLRNQLGKTSRNGLFLSGARLFISWWLENFTRGSCRYFGSRPYFGVYSPGPDDLRLRLFRSDRLILRHIFTRVDSLKLWQKTCSVHSRSC